MSEASKIVEKTINIEYQLSFGYDLMNTVMRIIKEEDLTIVNQKLELNCEIQMAVRKKDSKKIFELFENTYKVSIKKIED